VAHAACNARHAACNAGTCGGSCCRVVDQHLLEVGPPLLTFCAELHAALLAAVELEAALGPCDVTAVAREVVIVQCCDADGILVVLEAPNDVRRSGQAR
jgi:hypothetical protein